MIQHDLVDWTSGGRYDPSLSSRDGYLENGWVWNVGRGAGVVCIQLASLNVGM